MCLVINWLRNPLLVRNSFECFFFFFPLFVLGGCLGLIFVIGIIFFISFKNINNIVEGAKCNFIETNC